MSKITTVQNRQGRTRLAALIVVSLLGSSCGATAGAPAGQAGPSPEASQGGSPAPSADWPTYGHDGGRTGYNGGETTISAQSLGRLGPLWQADIGIGAVPPSGAPTVAEGRVFVGSSRYDGDNFFALDARTGRQLWSADVGRLPPSDLDVGMGATAAVSGSIVVVGGGDAAYYGLDAATGTILWRHPLDVGPSGFAWASPLIGNRCVYVGVASHFDDPPVRGELRALDLQTGSLLESQFFVPEGARGAGIWNSPALSPDGRLLVVATGEDFGGYDGPFNRAIVSLDPTTLEILQANKQATTKQDLDFGTTPIFFGDRQGRVLVGANQKNGVFYAYEADRISAGPVWQRNTGLSVGMMPAYDPSRPGGGTLLIVGDNGQLFAVDPATGADRWPPVAIGFMYGNMALANGLVFVSSGGSVIVLDADSGKLLRTLTPSSPGPSYSGVVVANGFIYWMSGAFLNTWSIG